MRKKKLSNDHEDMDLPAPEKDPEPVEIDDGIDPEIHGSHEIMAFLRLLMFILVILIIFVLAYGLWRSEIVSLWKSLAASFS